VARGRGTAPSVVRNARALAAAIKTRRVSYAETDRRRSSGPEALSTGARPLMKPGHRADFSEASGNRQSRKRAGRIHGGVARHIGIAIVSGRHASGAVLGGEIFSSQKLCVSRTAYREAIRILAAKGLVDSRPKTGTRVNPRSKLNWMDPDILDWVFQAEPHRDVLDALFELRQLIEPHAAALAARRRTGVQLSTLRRHLDDMRQYGLSSEEGQRPCVPCGSARCDPESLPDCTGYQYPGRRLRHDGVQASGISAPTRCDSRSRTGV
jgi:hypothetical protein